MFLEEVAQVFKGELFTTSEGINGVQMIPSARLGAPCNSGVGAILLADYFGAERIILIGFDCHKRNGTHHHGDHPRGLGNAGSMPKWPRQFREAAARIRSDVVNCSPGTALNAFPKGDLEKYLENPVSG